MDVMDSHGYLKGMYGGSHLSVNLVDTDKFICKLQENSGFDTDNMDIMDSHGYLKGMYGGSHLSVNLADMDRLYIQNTREQWI